MEEYEVSSFAIVMAPNNTSLVCHNQKTMSGSECLYTWHVRQAYWSRPAKPNYDKPLVEKETQQQQHHLQDLAHALNDQPGLSYKEQS